MTDLLSHEEFIIEEGKKLQIGKFVDSNLEFNVNFLQYVKIFTIIDACEEEIKTEHPEFNGNFLDNEVSLSKYRELVRTCYLQKIKLQELYRLLLRRNQ